MSSEMAEVTKSADLREWIDDYLTYLIRAWEGVPLNAAEWDDRDDLSQLTYVVNWGVPADRMAQLQRWAEQDILSPKQRIRYEELLKLVDQHGPTLERLLAD